MLLVKISNIGNAEVPAGTGRLNNQWKKRLVKKFTLLLALPVIIYSVTIFVDKKQVL